MINGSIYREIPDISFSPEEYIQNQENDELIQKWLKTLDIQLRITVILKCYLNFSIESKDPVEPTISSILKIDRRTICILNLLSKQSRICYLHRTGGSLSSMTF